MFVKKPSFWLTSLAGLFLLFSLLAINVHAADDEDAAGREEYSEAGFEELEAGSSNFTSSKVAELPYVLPNLYKRHLVSSFSLGHVSQTRGGEETSRDTYTSVSASFAYNLQRKRSEYVFDYRASGRHSTRLREANTFTHDLGLSSIVQLSPRTSWILNHRFSFTPDFSGSLVREGLARDAFFNNPVPPGGISSISTLVNPFPEFHSPVDGLDNTLGSRRMTNSTTGTLVHQLSNRTSLFWQAGFQKQQFEHDDLFGAETYRLSTGMNRRLSTRTSVGFSYQTSRFDQTGNFGRTVYQSVGVSFSHLLTPSTMLSVSIGPAWIKNQGQAMIPLSPVLANLLGRPALFRDASRSTSFWMGSANVATNWQWNRVNFGLAYNRSVSNTVRFGGASKSESVVLNLGRRLTRRTVLSVSVSHIRNQLLAIQNAPRLDQQAIHGTLTRQLSSGLDLSLFFSYSRLLTPVPRSLGFIQNQFGIRFMYHFPRMNGS